MVWDISATSATLGGLEQWDIPVTLITSQSSFSLNPFQAEFFY
jgi:hypothetical protein